MASVRRAVARPQRRADPRSAHRPAWAAPGVGRARRHFTGADPGGDRRGGSPLPAPLRGRFGRARGIDPIAPGGPARARRQHDHDAAYRVDRSGAHACRAPAQRLAETDSDKDRARNRTALVQTSDPRSLFEPGHLSRRIAGRGCRRARDVRQAAGWNRYGRGGGIGGAAQGAQCAARSAGAARREHTHCDGG